MISTLVSLTSTAQTFRAATSSATTAPTAYTKGGTDAADSAAKRNTRLYADQRAAVAQEAAVSRSASDATNKANASLASSKAYTDAKFLEGYKAGYKSADSLNLIRMEQERLRNDSLYLRKSDQLTVLPGDKIRFDSTGIKTIKISGQ